MNREAIFCDETEDYRIPLEPMPGDVVRFRLRAARGDSLTVRLATSGGEHRLELAESAGMFDYYETSFVVGEEPFCYWFVIEDGSESAEYNRLGFRGRRDESSLFRVIPGKKTPAWAEGAVMYQIFVDRFCDGDRYNNVRDREYRYVGRDAEAVEEWYDMPEPFDVHRFYGGDLQGILDKLDYLSKLGVEVLYLNPIFVSPSNHKYDCQDYDAVDPHYTLIAKEGDYTTRVTDPANLEASNAFFAAFVKEVHRRGMRVIIDGVLNHCGSFHKWMNREKIYRRQEGYPAGAYESANSPYRSYFSFSRDEWPDNDSYEGWWGYETLPKLNYEGSEELWREVLRIGRKWVSAPYGVDGWRLDVAADLGHSPETNHRFWKEFRTQVREANPDAIVLAEHYSDPYPWINGDEWDTVMNYGAFMEPVTWYLTGMEKHSDSFREDLLGNAEAFWATMRENMPRLGSGLRIAMNQLSNHDHSRFLTRTNRTVGRLATAGGDRAAMGVRYSSMYQAVVIQMTWPGAPTLYYGDEAGLCGWTDPDSRRPYPWGYENTGLISFHRAAIALHRERRSLRAGSLHELVSDGPVIAYGRSLGKDRVVVIVNVADEARYVSVPVWKTGANPDGRFENLLKTSPLGFDQIPDELAASGGYLEITMVGQSSIVLGEINE